MSYETCRRLRDENGMNDFYVSRQTGIAAATLSSWKHGKYKPKFLTLAALAQFFNVPVETFLDGNEEVNHVRPVDDARIKALERKVADLEAQVQSLMGAIRIGQEILDHRHKSTSEETQSMAELGVRLALDQNPQFRDILQ